MLLKHLDILKPALRHPLQRSCNDANKSSTIRRPKMESHIFSLSHSTQRPQKHTTVCFEKRGGGGGKTWRSWRGFPITAMQERRGWHMWDDEESKSLLLFKLLLKLLFKLLFKLLLLGIILNRPQLLLCPTTHPSPLCLDLSFSLFVTGSRCCYCHTMTCTLMTTVQPCIFQGAPASTHTENMGCFSFAFGPSR